MSAPQTVPQKPVEKPAKPRVMREYIGVYHDPSREPKEQWVVAVITYDGQKLTEEIVFSTHSPILATRAAQMENVRRFQHFLRGG